MNVGFKKKKPLNHGYGLVCVLVNEFCCFDKKLYLVPAVRTMPHCVDLSVIINRLELCHISYLYYFVYRLEIII